MSHRGFIVHSACYTSGFVEKFSYFASIVFLSSLLKKIHSCEKNFLVVVMYRLICVNDWWCSCFFLASNLHSKHSYSITVWFLFTIPNRDWIPVCEFYLLIVIFSIKHFSEFLSVKARTWTCKYVQAQFIYGIMMLINIYWTTQTILSNFKNSKECCGIMLLFQWNLICWIYGRGVMKIVALVKSYLQQKGVCITDTPS